MRLCLFCSASANSLEDAWPQWITNQFKGSRPAAVQAERAGVTLPSWNVHKPTLKIRCVCEQCNNGWMSRLEGRVQPFLQPLLIGASGALDMVGQTTIATWAVVTVVHRSMTDPRNDETGVEWSHGVGKEVGLRLVP